VAETPRRIPVVSDSCARIGISLVLGVWGPAFLAASAVNWRLRIEKGVRAALTIAVLTAFAGMVSGWVLLRADKPTDLGTLAVDRSRSVRLWSDPQSWDGPQQFVSFEVLVDGKPVRSGTLGVINAPSVEDLKFALIASADRNLVAVVERSNPDVVLMLHEFLSGAGWSSWSSQTSRTLFRDSREVSSTLERLRCDAGTSGLVLSDQVSGRQLLVH
jgi:hypothetical protein